MEVQAPHGSEVDIPPEFGFEKLLNIHRLKQPDVALRVEVENDIHVRLRDVVTASDGAEECSVADALGFERRLQFAKAPQHVVARSVVGSQLRPVRHPLQFEERGVPGLLRMSQYGRDAMR